MSRFALVGTEGRHNTYSATVRPWLWLLTRTANCRIFQEKSVPDVIKQVFRDLGLTDFDDATTGTYSPWDYLVQYRESGVRGLRLSGRVPRDRRWRRAPRKRLEELQALHEQTDGSGLYLVYK